MNCPAWRPPQRTGRSLFAALCAFLAVAGGCSGGGGGDSATPPGPQAAADDDFLLTASAALSEGQLTLNNRWTQADLDAQNITVPITYEGLLQPAGRVRPYTMLLQEYRVRRQQCEEDFNKWHPVTVYDVPSPGARYTIQDRKCYPTLTDRPARIISGPPIIPGGVADKVLRRYGYYSGGGFPPELPSNPSPFREGTPEPLDPVDYCSRLHDKGAWAGQVADAASVNFGNECGIIMCLGSASGLPANVMALLPEVEKARKHWYDGATGEVLFLDVVCAGNQLPLPAPVLGP